MTNWLGVRGWIRLIFFAGLLWQLAACSALVFFANKRMWVAVGFTATTIWVMNGVVLTARRYRRWWDRGPTPPPDAPQNVRLVTQDGTVVPLELVYMGWNGKGHVWEVTRVIARDGEQMLMAEKVPDDTIIVLKRGRV
jgi:hypothetical protein